MRTGGNRPSKKEPQRSCGSRSRSTDRADSSWKPAVNWSGRREDGSRAMIAGKVAAITGPSSGIGEGRAARRPHKPQGRYMGYMRQLKPRQKAQVRKVREAKGVRAAIALGKTLRGA